MRPITSDSSDFLAASARPRWLDRLARQLFNARLERLQHGRIVIREYGVRTGYGEADSDCSLAVEVHVRDPRFYSDVVFGGSIGSGEAYVQGYWGCDSLADLVRILLRNREVLEAVDAGAARFAKPARRLLHWLNRNTRRGSRRNIAAHYDLGNDFYSLWLDPQMMYSSAYFETPETSLDEAAIAKLDMICRKLELGPEDHVLEIGSGWGGFAIHAARHYGCRVTTTTISREQHALAGERIREAGLQDRITLLGSDYRDLEGSYDKLVSIEMIEAVGHQFHSTFFRKCCSLLKPEGKMLLQAIPIADQRYAAYKRNVDFIRRYIFPGGCLTSVTDMCRVLTEHTDMRVLHLEDIGLHYAQTLREWRERFFAALDQVRGLGYSEQFVRLWDYYLCFCEGAFEERAIGDVQMLIVRPQAR